MRNALFFLCLLPILSISQIEIKGNIVDKSNQPIPYVNLYNLQKSIGTVCDENGDFKLVIKNQNNLKDSIKVSSIGFETKTILINDLTENSTIQLLSSAKELSVFEVKAYKYIVKEIGNLKKPDFGSYSMTPGGEWACWIPNEKGRVGFIKTASVYVRDVGTPNAPFRLKLYSRNKITEMPDANLLIANIILKGTTGNEWVTANLDSLKIPIPKEGFFIGVEWLKSSSELVVKERLGNLTLTHHGQVIGAVSERIKKGSRTYYKDYLNDWSFNDYYKRDGLTNVINLSVKAEISYRKGVFEKNENTRTNYKEIKQRQLKKYAEVPEMDLKRYPNYSILKLFESIEKSVELDEIPYALFYLCRYEKEAKKELLEDLKELKEKNEPFLNEKERLEVLIDFQYYISHLEFAEIIAIDKDKYEVKFPNGVTTFVQEIGLIDKMVDKMS